MLYRAVLKVVQLYWTRRMIQLSICGTAHGWAGMQHMSGWCLISVCVLLGDVRALMGAVRRSRPSRHLPKMGRLKEINGSNIRYTDTHTFLWSWEASVVVSNEKQAPNLALGGAGAVVLHCRTLYLVPVQGRRGRASRLLPRCGYGHGRGGYGKKLGLHRSPTSLPLV